MFRIIATIVVGALVGIGLGRFQASVATSGFEERFAGSRATLAEVRGEKTKAEVVAQSTGTPKVEVEGGTEFRFGTMQHGDSMSHDFVFRNIGDGPLNLDMGASTCKCTVGELKSSILQPGESTIVTLTWTAVAIQAEYGQTATILTTAPDSPEVRLQIRGQIADSFVIEPSSLDLGTLSVSDEVTRTFHVFTYLKKAKELTDFVWTDEKTQKLVDISCKKVDLDLEKFPQHRNAFGVHEVEVKIKPGLQMGQANARITFSTDQEEKVGVLEIPVSGLVTSDVVLIGGPSFDPKQNKLKLGTVKSSEGAAVSISLAAQGEFRDNLNPQIVSVKPAESLNVTIGEAKIVGSRKLFPIIFEVPKGAPETHYAGGSPKDFGKVVVRMNAESAQDITIHIQLNVVK